ncbi:MAG: hypothetical protein ACRDZ4_16495 [Egibacteraceae bacterium]
MNATLDIAQLAARAPASRNRYLDFLWRDGTLTGRPRTAWLLLVSGLLVLVALVGSGPYPLSMVGTDTGATSNSPPMVVLVVPLVVVFSPVERRALGAAAPRGTAARALLGVAGVSAGIGLLIRGSLMSAWFPAALFSTGCVLLGAFGLEGRRRA